MSGPGCVTSARRSPVRTLTIEMSELPPSPGSGLVAWSKAISLPSGDQSKPETLNAPSVSRRAFFDATSITCRCVMRWSAPTTSYSPDFFSRSFVASLFGSCAVKAIFWPSRDHANAWTPSSSAVSASASPPRRSIR